MYPNLTSISLLLAVKAVFTITLSRVSIITEEKKNKRSSRGSLVSFEGWLWEGTA